MNTTELITFLTAAHGLSGREQDAATVAAALMEDLGEIARTPLGSLLCLLPGGSPSAPLVMLEAHLDQIGLVVTSLEEGFLRFANCGGVDCRLLPAMAVTVHTDGGPRRGVVTSVPPHLKGEGDKPPKMEALRIDTGYDAAAAREIFAPGDVVTLDAPAIELAGGRLTGSAMDDRAGCAAVIRAAQLISQRECNCRVVVALCSMEEIGGQGASTAAFAVAPDACFAVDVSFGDGPGVPEHKCGKLGGGPMIGFSPILDRTMSRRLVALAKEQNIPYQCEVIAGGTGTDADKIVTSGQGVPTALVSIPLRNMHTPVEVVAVTDVDDTARLIAAAVCEMGGTA